MTETLKPCPNPWCCGQGEMRNHDRRGDWWVQCDQCPLEHPARCTTEDEAVAAWNTRAPDDVAQIVVALKAVYDEGRFNHNTRCRKWWPQVCAALEELEG